MNTATNSPMAQGLLCSGVYCGSF